MNTVIQKSPTPTAPAPGYALSTATGSLGQWWYGRYRLVNDGTETLYEFRDEAFPEPRATNVRRADNNFMVTQLVFDPLMLVNVESRPYDPDRIVLVSAERAWLRDKRRRAKKLAAQERGY
jgi:hypothetical protein